MNFLEVIAKRRDWGVHSPEELAFLAKGAASGELPDYQLSAWLMAAYLNPLNQEETVSLTIAMADSGRRLDLSSLPEPTLDKHSTGGVGDKTTIVLLPLLAACGVTMVKMSGRALGITGGTIDKLASIPGFRTDLSPDELISQARRIGLAITGQTPDLAPADKTLYALRDVTGTVASVPLIVSSILSKKLAGGAKNVLLDVKCGSGSFMPDLGRARELASALKIAAYAVGLNLRLAITDMDQPLGRTAGNALEVGEAIEVLKGQGTGRFPALCLNLAALGLISAGLAKTQEQGLETAKQVLESGAALEKARLWIEAQGGDISVLDRDGIPSAAIAEVKFEGRPGFAKRVDARAVGMAAGELGEGRQSKDDFVDPTAGVETLVEVGDPVAPGETVFRIHASAQKPIEDVRLRLAAALEVSPSPVPAVSPILEVL